MNYQGTVESGTLFPPKYNLTWALDSATTINVTYDVATSGTFTALHVSILIFDAYKINISPGYRVYYGRFNADAGPAGEFMLPDGLQNNVFMGMEDFYGTSTKQYLSYGLKYGALANGTYGIKVAPSTPPGSPILTYGFTYFYLLEIGCLPNFYY